MSNDNEKISLVCEDINPQKIKLLSNWIIGPHVVDAGCGTGNYSQHIKHMGMSVVAIDSVDRIKTKEGITFIQAKIPPIPLPDKSCDTCVLFDVMEHIEEENALLLEAKRITKKRLILSVPSSDNGILPQFGICHVHNIDKTHKREYSPSTLEFALKSNGFKLTHLEPHYPKAIPFVAGAFFKKNILGKIMKVTTISWINALTRMGIVCVDLPADWFAVADLI